MKRRRGAIKSLGEAHTTGVLRRYFHGKPYVIHKDVALNQVIEVAKGDLQGEEFGFYTRASLDFLVCQDDDDQTFEIAIEYDGRYHENPRQQWRDRLKNRICIQSGIPILRVGYDETTVHGKTSILDFILDHYFGEKALERLREAGELGPEDEYFVPFNETSTIQRSLIKRGLFPPVFVVNEPAGSNLHWYRVMEKGVKFLSKSESAQNVLTARTLVEIFKGPTTDHKVFHVDKTATIRDPNPQQNVLGVHGWYIASELAQYLCFKYIEMEWLPE